MEKKTYYITTPIYYPSGKWHLGHSYTTVCCDAIARYKRMRDFDVFYLTGTDEHGQKIEKSATEAGKTPKQFVDERVSNIKKLWELLDISYDKFIRTTDDYHVSAVQKIFKTLYEKGDIYKSKYKGKYCTPCESFWTESQLIDGKCPDCGREVIDAEEESYFFRLSKYQDRIRDLLTNGEFLQPQSRVNEMVNNFLKAGLTDLAVSRTSFKWGIPVEFDEGHIVYVWIDALSNYITALGYGSQDATLFDKYWPADLHMVGKEIVRFHTIIWPAILMALDLPVPQKVYGHGWLLLGGDKMSKSKGNVVDPFVLAERYGVDAIRYYILREIPFGSDGVYTNEAFIGRINSDLCNDLGNLAKRTLAMAKQYFGGQINANGEKGEFDDEFIALINGLDKKMDDAIDAINPSRALEEIFNVIGKANKYIDNTAPWVLAKDESKKNRLMAVMYNLIEAIRVTATALLPFITVTPKKIFASLGVEVPTTFAGNLVHGAIKRYATGEIESLFPRIDIKKELQIMEQLAKEEVKVEEKKEEVKEEVKAEPEFISIDEFFRAKLVVGEILACEKVEKADKLLKSTVKMGDEVRTILSGIAKHYTPEEMVGKKVVVVANLAPRKIRGIESQGMLLCATTKDGDLCLVTPEKDMESGSEVC
ncbi:MAG: methionine--tRNA ligase [Clostridia bacterium]|nr:methionine--tRNA ligase [Clostridia bacterium]